MRTNISETTTKINIKKYLKYFLILLLITVLHTVFLAFIEIANIIPDLFVILVIWISLKEGRFVGLIAGFLTGLFVDAISIDVLGTNALAKVIAAFIASCFYNENNNNTTQNIKFIWIVLLSVFVHNIIYTFFYIKLTEQNFLTFYLKNGIFTTVYTTFFAIFIILFQIPYKRIKI